MPATPASTLRHSPLERLLVSEGASMAARHGWWVATHFGSPPGEIALCSTAVGLADRCDLAKLELRAEPSAIEQLVGQLTGGQLAPGDALWASGAWWCSISPEHVLVICEPSEAARTHEALGDAARWTPGAQVSDSTTRLAALALLGPAAGPLLDELDGAGPRMVESEPPELDATRLASVPVLILRTAPDRAVVVAEQGRAEELWRELERAGRPLGLGHVGTEAVERLALIER
jgi:glycine cleavage system aminomethyltransferase T